MNSSLLPTNDELFIPVFRAIKELGSIGTNNEINERVYSIAKISEKAKKIPHGEYDDGISDIDYRILFSLNYLKKIRLVENLQDSRWAFTDTSNKLKSLTKDKLIEEIANLCKKEKKGSEFAISKINKEIYSEVEKQIWIAKLLEILCDISSDSFERLTKTLLTKMNYENVVVTGKTGDRGIDGMGMINGNGKTDLFLEKFIFQCKCYRHNRPISGEEMRAFTGAILQKNLTKGIFVTTSYFSEDAKLASLIDKFISIELIDGHLFCEKLMKYEIGIRKIETIELCETHFAKL